MKRLKLLALAGGMFVSMIAAPSVHAQAVDIWPQCDENSQSKVCEAATTGGEQPATAMVKKIINVLLYALGITAVIMIVWAGMKYVMSRGDAANVKSAKDTLTYAVLGLIVALFSYAIVNFVISSFK